MIRKTICAMVCGLAVGVKAQDTRVVTEPKVPSVCVRLEAKLVATPDANGGHLRDEDEAKLDTDRIQKALQAGDGGGAGIGGRQRGIS